MEAPGQLPSLPSPISSPGTGNVYKTSILTFFEVYIYIYIYAYMYSRQPNFDVLAKSEIGNTFSQHQPI